jgi:type IV secretion system protein VirD4
MTPALLTAAALALAAALTIKGTVFSRVQHRRIYWRIKLRLHPGPGFASYAELLWRWSRYAAVRHGRRVRPDMPWAARMTRPATSYSWRLGRGQWFKRVFVPAEHQRVIIAPPRMAKTGALAEQILAHPGACVTFSSRADLYDLTAGTRTALGPLRVFNPFGVGGLDSNLHWDIIAGCQDPEVAFLRAAALVGDVAPGDMAFWLEKSAVTLAMLMHLAAVQGYDISAVYAWANKFGQDTVLSAASDPRVSRDLAASCMEMLTDSKSADSIRMTMNRSLGWVTIPQLKAMVTGPAAAPFDAAEFAGSRGTLYMIMREGATSVAAPLFRALTDHLHRSTILAGSLTPWRKLSPGVFFALDEVANIGVPALAQKLADSAGYGAFFTIVIHSLAQLRDAYGPDKASSIWSCCGCKMILPGVDDADTLEHLSTLCGTTTQGETKVPVISPESIRMLPDTRALIILVNRPPVAVKFRIPWHRVSYRLGRLPKAPRPFMLPQYTVPELWEEEDLTDAAA